MAHEAHGASDWVSSGNQPEREHEGLGGASDGDIRSAVRRSCSDLRRSKSSRRHVLQRAKRRSATPRPATGSELVKQRITELEDQQREDRAALRRLEQVLQGSRRSTRSATSGDAGSENEPRMEMFCFVLFGLQLSVCLWWLQVPLRDLSQTCTVGLRVTAEETRCRIAT